MSFHYSAVDIRIENGHILKAKLKDCNGDEQSAEIDLNGCLGNDNGRFEWDGVDFSHSAEDVTFSIEGGGSVPVLRARLKDTDGNFVNADVNLSERIENVDGRFVMGND